MSTPKKNKEIKGFVNMLKGKSPKTFGDILGNLPISELATKPEHEWNGTKLKFEDSNGDWGDEIDLKGEKGDTPVKGIDYFDGEDGYTPVKGIDYFDGKDGKDGYTPVKGKDYYEGKDGKDGKDGYTPVKGKDYFDGKDGISTDPKAVIAELKNLKGKDRLPLSALEGNEFLMKLGDDNVRYKIEELMHGGGASKFTDLNDTPSSYSGQAGKAVFVNPGETGLQFQAAVSSDEKVKYDAGDPNAGYVADKFVAGTGITLAEGTGADENKLKITNSAPAGSGSDTTAWHLNGDTLGAKKTLGSIDNQDIGFITNNTERLTVLKDGNVGIGTTAPGALLDVSSGGLTILAGADIAATTRTNLTTKRMKIALPHYTNAEEPVTFVFGTSDSTSNSLFIGGNVSDQNSATKIGFFTGATQTTLAGTERMTILAGGNVGIGTTNPTAPFTIYRDGASNIGSFLLDQPTVPTGSTSKGPHFFFKSGGIDRGWFGFFDSAAHGNGTALNLRSAGDVRLGASIGNSPDMIIKVGGNVGIGTTTPTAYLNIKAGTATAGTAPLKFTAGTVNTTPEAGAIEFDGTDFWLTV